MTKHVLGVLGFAVVSIFALSQSAKADFIDPFMNEFGTNSCPAGCASAGLGSDPLNGGVTTVEYIFNSTIPNVVQGDVKITEFGGSTVGDLIRFENITINNVPTAVAFIYSSDVGTGLPADVALPSFLTNTATLAEDIHESTGFSYFPTAGQPGYCSTGSTAPVSCGVGYGLQSDAVPEPASLALLGAGLLGLGFLRRRKAA